MASGSTLRYVLVTCHHLYDEEEIREAKEESIFPVLIAAF